MKKAILQFVVLLSVLTGISQAATVTVTTVDDGVSNIGAPGTFYWAITNCNAGDTIAFNISGTGPFFLQVPPNGFPLIYHKHNLIIDGYTQPGASPNSNPITGTNNAVIQIVIDGRNGNSRNLVYTAFNGTLATSDPPIDNTFMATEQGGYGASEKMLLAVYRSRNVNIRGLAFVAKPTPTGGGTYKGIGFAHDYDGDTSVTNQSAYVNGLAYGSGSDANGHVNGCWFGFNPTNKTAGGLARYEMAISGYRHRDVSGGPRPELPNVGLIIGVAPGSANPRAEFNVFAGVAQAFSGEAVRTHVAGNFFNVLPDGVTAITFDLMSLYFQANIPFEFGRYDDTQPMVFGTDGDGVNDADEGNLWGLGPLDSTQCQSVPMLNNYNTGNKPWIFAGNTYGIANNGTVWPDNSFSIGSFNMQDGTKVRFGSDFNGVSDALEANRVYNNNVFDSDLMFGLGAILSYTNSPSVAKDMIGMGSASIDGGQPKYNPANPDSFVSIRGNVLVNNFPGLNPGDKTVGPIIFGEITGAFYNDIWKNYILNTNVFISSVFNTNASYTNIYHFLTNVFFISQTIPELSASSSVSTLIGTCGYPTNGYTNLIVDVDLPDPMGQTNGAKFNLPEFGGTAGWGFVQGKTHLGSFLDNGPYDSDPAVGAFSFNISSLGLTAGTKVTAAVTYSRDERPNVTKISRSGNNVTLTWTGGNGSGASGFGIQRASTITGAWETFGYSPTNGIVLTDTASTRFYRIQGPGVGMTTLFAKPVVLTP